VTRSACKAVVIGASAGAVQALLDILPALPAEGRVIVLVAVHVPADRSNALIPLLQTRCRASLKEAEDKEPALPGQVYFAPSDYHLLVEQDGSLALSSDEPVHHARPSIDVLFESAADAWGDALVGVILTGANADGARGLAAIHAAGGEALVQAPAEAAAPTMPAAALAACPQARVMTLTDIANHLSALTRE